MPQSQACWSRIVAMALVAVPQDWGFSDHLTLLRDSFITKVSHNHQADGNPTASAKRFLRHSSSFATASINSGQRAPPCPNMVSRACRALVLCGLEHATCFPQFSLNLDALGFACIL
jgi:hypothetical protein